ncbi:MAG: CRISPR-associated protein Cas4 [Anaerolineales bacterium]|nr:CRISPR-associated protein Cas4 [Anaerolineales bacterium]
MLDNTLRDQQMPFRVTDLKQWVYCPRILYYALCLPDVRPVTYKMKAGVEAGQAEAQREGRRSLRAYGLSQGRRQFDLRVSSERLGMRGVVDMVVWVDVPIGPKNAAGLEVVPVDYKLSRTPGEHFKLQLAAYAVMLEESSGGVARQGFLYMIPLRRAQAVRLDGRLRKQLFKALDEMHRMLAGEWMPDPTPRRGRCVSCEFRRFCNDVL